MVLVFDFILKIGNHTFKSGDFFMKDKVAITSTGIAMQDNPKMFHLVYDEIEIGDMIGRGSSSIVLHGVHGPTGTPLALKVSPR